MFILVVIFIFILGTIIGSFLNVVIDRIPAGFPLTGRSHCDHCQKELTPQELIPLLSFLWQKGHCTACGAKLEWQYPLVELTTGLLFVLAFVRFSSASFSLPLSPSPYLLTPNLLFHLFLFSSLLTLAIIDFKTSLLPDIINLPTIVISLIFLFIFSPLHIFLTSLITALISAFFFWLIIFLTKGRGMGEGDIRLGFLMGLILGWPKTLIALYLAFFLGAFVALALIAGRKKRFGQTIPFGPFLILATFLMMFWGETLQNFWFRMFGF